MPLVIVESPTKARTLTRFLDKSYSVMASMGHVRDLPKSQLGVDVEHKFKPTYVVEDTKKKLVNELIRASKKTNQIIIATDPDREGEAIGYHLEWLIKQNLKKSKQKPSFSRAVFHEITKSAILNALTHLGKINHALVDAQQTRRVLDRLVGYKLSPVLWKKVRRGLSAGRVQSVAVRLIVDREKEIEAFKPEEYWEIGAEVKKYKGENKRFNIDLYKIDEKKAKEEKTVQAKSIVKDLEKASYIVEHIEKKETRQNPPPPFITSTLQRTGANLFNWTSKKTMREAQQLYERGYITYHRTDSVNLSSLALSIAADYINEKFGRNYAADHPRQFRTKSKLAQEAHEAIRPTKLKRDLGIVEKRCGLGGLKLYKLIFNRF